MYDVSSELRDIAKIELKRLESFDLLFIGCSLWYTGDLQDDWKSKYKKTDALNLLGKYLALLAQAISLSTATRFKMPPKFWRRNF